MDFTSNIGLHVPPGFNVSQPGSFGIALWFLFVLFIVFYFVISAVLMFHWSRYGMGSRTIAGARAIYLSVSLAFIIIAGVFLSAL